VMLALIAMLCGLAVLGIFAWLDLDLPTSP
jgi:hypothetical protein